MTETWSLLLKENSVQNISFLLTASLCSSVLHNLTQLSLLHFAFPKAPLTQSWILTGVFIKRHKSNSPVFSRSYQNVQMHFHWVETICEPSCLHRSFLNILCSPSAMLWFVLLESHMCRMSLGWLLYFYKQHRNSRKKFLMFLTLLENDSLFPFQRG